MALFRPCLLVSAALALVACGGEGGGLLDRGKRTPDEFAVYSRAPLTLPPDYGLRPPTPGTERAEGEPSRDARDALVGSPAYPTGHSAVGGYSLGRLTSGSATSGVPAAGTPGVVALMDRTGALAAEPDIRAQVNRETAILAEEDQSFTDRLIFWGTPTEYGVVVDPVEESRRIKENLALGRTITAGDTPTIERRRRGLLEGIFN